MGKRRPYQILKEELAERKRLESDLRGAKNFTEKILRLAPSAIFTVDRKKRITSWNKRAEEITGYKAKETIGKECILFARPPCEDSCGLYSKKIKKPILHRECVIRTKKGKRVIILKNADLLKDENGKVIGGIESFEEITERKKSQEALLETASNLRERLKELNSLYSLSKLIARPNIKLEEIMENVPRLLPPAWRYPEVTCARVIFEGKEYKTDNFKLSGWKQTANIMAHGKIRGSIEVCYLKKPKSYEGLFLKEERDLIDAFAERLGRLVERRSAEEGLAKAYKDLKDSQEQLIQSAKLAAIGQLATGAAHEVNNPLSVISGEAEMLLTDETKDKDVRNASKVIIEQAARIKKITEGLLDFAHKREMPKKKPFDVNSVIKRALRLLNYRIELQNIKVVEELNLGLPKALGDDNQVEQVFLNIMLNAIQAMEGGGKLVIKTGCEKDKERTMVVIEFKDTGKGMDKKTVGRVFEPFFTTKEKNTGLGLSVSYGIIEDHGGIIKVKSKRGEGTVFTVKLPAIGGGE